ncbi:MAG TPA: FtsQ-type POTRA domain-containing protein [Solirubrobacteraceae bacterium]|nr:FtsQ-type POTRA domain-containing protein [Solirubrobacteraceae bacterium]
MDRSFALRLPRPVVIPMPRRPLLWLAVALLALPALGGSWMWLRDSSLVSVEHVHITGARGADGRAIRVALDEAARHMSTLHVKLGALRAAVAPFRVVRDLKVSSGFPHTLSIQVIEQPPVAALTVGAVKTAAAADGAILGPSLLRGSLPVVAGASGDPIGTGQVKSSATLAALSVLGAAPPALAGWVARVYTGKEGLTVRMRNGLLLYFGDATRADAKWLSVVRVLADPSSQGAWYVDVRLPQRPAAGLVGGASATSQSTSSLGQVGASDPTAASLSTSLAEAVNGSAGGGSTPGSATSTPLATAPATSTSTSSTPTTAPSATPTEATSTAPTASTSAPTEAAPEAAAATPTGG